MRERSLPRLWGREGRGRRLLSTFGFPLPTSPANGGGAQALRSLAMPIDAVDLEVMKASLSGIVQEMQNSLFPTGFSTIVR